MTDDDLDFTAAPASPAPAPPKASPAAAAPSAPSAPAAPAKSKFYDAAIARKLFQAHGVAETIPAGGAFFVENEKASKGGLFSKAVANRMFFIESGEVSLTAQGKVLDAIGAGEIFGEMAVITGGPRSATATAKSNCTAYSLDAVQLQSAIQRMPEFALMLMSVMFDRLRLVAARLAARKVAPGLQTAREAATFPQDMLQQLQDYLHASAKVRYESGKVIMREGDAGICMYVVAKGRVAIAIRDKIVEMVGPGGTFGEMALVDQSPRTASAGATVDCELLSVNRKALLDLIKAHPAFGVTMLRAVADRLRHMNALLAS
ncbi:MAG: cyclic nucleotide-binding domain-containing protein [Betaproteobacteria bacterium]|nr:cyclic nucleotide-binding domain-containing protein [Betaproteobacteria bacterium]